MNSKSIFESRTFWVNLLGGLVTAGGTAWGTIPQKYAPIIMAVGGIANILLRLVTTQPVTIATPPASVGPGRIGVVLLVSMLGLTTVSCASLPRNPDGSLNVPVLLMWAEDGIQADCAIQGASAEVCSIGLPALQAVEAAVANDPTNAEARVRAALVNITTRWPQTGWYLDWLIKVLPA